MLIKENTLNFPYIKGKIIDFIKKKQQKHWGFKIKTRPKKFSPHQDL